MIEILGAIVSGYDYDVKDLMMDLWKLSLGYFAVTLGRIGGWGKRFTIRPRAIPPVVSLALALL